MAMGARTAMLTNADFLTLSQWLSPAYPVGAFAYSHGLEALADHGDVGDVEGLCVFLEDILRFGSGHSDALFLAAAYRADNSADLCGINQTARAFAPSKERLFETEQQGHAFGSVTSQIWKTDPKGLVYPVALGYAAKCEGLPLLPTSTLYLQAFVSNLVAAGQRLCPIGQTDAQRIVRKLSPLCAQIAEMTSDGNLDHLTSTAFLADIASMKHETQYSRIFRT